MDFFQISCLLNPKVDELKVQLETATGSLADGVSGDSKVSTARRRKDEKYREELRRMERERKEASEVYIYFLNLFQTLNQPT